MLVPSTVPPGPIPTGIATVVSEQVESMPDALESHPEAELLRRLRAGEDRAYRELYRQHSADIFRLARRFVYSDAEADEVVQEVFIAAFRYVDRFRGNSRVGTWLYRITVNRALKRRRWWGRRREVGPEPIEPMRSADVAPERHASDRQALEITRSCLDKLESRKRAVLVLHELEGFDTREIAEILECPRSTVLTRLARARTDLLKHARRAGLDVDSPASARRSKGRRADTTPANPEDASHDA